MTREASNLCQLVQSDRLFKQALVLGLESHFADDGSGVASKLIYNSRLEERRGEDIAVRADEGAPAGYWQQKPDATAVRPLPKNCD